MMISTRAVIPYPNTPPTHDPPTSSFNKQKHVERPLEKDELDTSDQPSEEVTGNEGIRKGIGEKKGLEPCVAL